MRNAFAGEITELAAKDERIVLLSGDIGNRLFDEYKHKFPDRFFNCGVAEANMVSMAAGMAMSGLCPVTYTIASFAITRCLEQIRIDLCYHNLHVIVVGVGGGLSYAENGATHQSCEDIAFMRVLPNMKVLCPGDALEARLAIRASLKETGPIYIRLGKKGEPVIHAKPPDFHIGKAITVSQGANVCLIATGNVLSLAIEAVGKLEKKGISTQVVSMHTVKPLDVAFLSDVFSRFSLVATIEEHSVLGGLGGSIAEWLAGFSVKNSRLLTIGLQDRFLYEAGRQNHARKCFGLTTESIINQVAEAYFSCKNHKTQ